MKIKKSQIMGTVCRKLAKYLLREFDESVSTGQVSLKKEDIKIQILENIKIIIEKAKKHIRQSDIGLKDRDSPKFIQRYGKHHKIAAIIKLCIDYLERDRQYDVSCLLLSKLLMNVENKPEKRGDWWVRLCIDLKHLKMKKESLKVAEHALLE